MTGLNRPKGPATHGKLRSEWPTRARDWVAVVAVGSFIGLDDAIFSVAIGSLLFSGHLAGGLGLAVTASMLATLVSAVALALFSRIRCNIGHVQDIGVAVLAQTLGVALATQPLPEETRIATALVIVALATLSSAALLWVTGVMRWGRIVRFFPQSVLAGFLAGTGWLLLAGGISITTGIAMADLLVPANWSPQAVTRALPALVFGVVLFAAMRLIAWKGVLIAGMIAGIAGFHLVLWGLDLPLASAQAAGWLPVIGTDATGIPNLAAALTQVDWPTVGAAVPTLATVAFLTLIGTLLNTSALTAVSHQPADADAELRLTGLVNLAVAAVAGPPSHTGIASSLVVLRAGVTQRGAGLVMAVVILISLFNVQALMTILPLFVTAGLIICVGLDLFHDWLIRTRRHYSHEEWAVVVIIVAIVILFGFAGAIMAGLLFASLIFAWNYASVPILRRSGSLRDRSSTLARAPAEAAWLRAHGDTVEVIELQGFMFFGTADRLYDHVYRRVSAADRQPLTRLIVDFQHVVGIDAAGAAQLGRVVALSAQDGFDLVFSGYPKKVLATLTRAAPGLLQGGRAVNVPSLDEALEAAEDAVLAGSPVWNSPAPTLLDRLAPDPADLPLLQRFLDQLPQEHLPRDSVIMAAGTPADSLIFLEQGRVAIRAPIQNGDAPRLRAMTSGAILGDIGLALNLQRTADVVAETDVILRRVSLADLQRIEQTAPPLSHALHRMRQRSLAEKIVYDERAANTGKAG